MAAQMVARAIFMRRQRDGLAGVVVWSRGGRVRDLPGNLFGDDSDDQPCVDPCSCQLRFFSRQHVEAGQALEPFEGQLNLPAKAIEGEDVGRREGIGRQRGQEKNVLRRLETARVGVLAALLGVLAQTLLLGFRLFRVLAPDNEAQHQRLRWRCPRRAFVDADLHFAFLLDLSGKRCKEIERLAVRLQQAQRVPAGTHDEVCTGLYHRPQIARSRIVAITQYDIAGPVAEALKILGTMQVGQLELIDLTGCQVVTDMQTPCRAVSSRLADRRSIEGTQAIPGPAPMIQNLRANLHPKLESYRDSLCPELNLAPMRVGVRGTLDRLGLAESPPHPALR